MATTQTRELETFLVAKGRATAQQIANKFNLTYDGAQKRIRAAIQQGVRIERTRPGRIDKHVYFYIGELPKEHPVLTRRVNGTEHTFDLLRWITRDYMVEGDFQDNMMDCLNIYNTWLLTTLDSETASNDNRYRKLCNQMLSATRQYADLLMAMHLAAKLSIDYIRDDNYKVWQLGETARVSELFNKRFADQPIDPDHITLNFSALENYENNKEDDQ